MTGRIDRRIHFPSQWQGFRMGVNYVFYVMTQ